MHILSGNKFSWVILYKGVGGRRGFGEPSSVICCDCTFMEGAAGWLSGVSGVLSFSSVAGSVAWMCAMAASGFCVGLAGGVTVLRT